MSSHGSKLSWCLSIASFPFVVISQIALPCAANRVNSYGRGTRSLMSSSAGCCNGIILPRSLRYPIPRPHRSLAATETDWRRVTWSLALALILRFNLATILDCLSCTFSPSGSSVPAPLQHDIVHFFLYLRSRSRIPVWKLTTMVSNSKTC